MADRINNNGQSGAAWFVNKMASEWRQAYREGKEAIWPSEKWESSEAGKARQDSFGVTTSGGDPEKLNKMYQTPPKKHTQIDNVQDTVAFSPEALAMMG